MIISLVIIGVLRGKGDGSGIGVVKCSISDDFLFIALILISIAITLIAISILNYEKTLRRYAILFANYPIIKGDFNF